MSLDDIRRDKIEERAQDIAEQRESREIGQRLYNESYRMKLGSIEKHRPRIIELMRDADWSKSVLEVFYLPRSKWFMPKRRVSLLVLKMGGARNDAELWLREDGVFQVRNEGRFYNLNQQQEADLQSVLEIVEQYRFIR